MANGSWGFTAQQDRRRPLSVLAGSSPVLVIDDDAETRSAIAEYVSTAGCTVEQAGSGHAGLAAIQQSRPALVVVEVVLPDISGYELCRYVKDEYGKAVPVVLISALRDLACDRVAGLLIGADDYLVKPFALDELMNRVRRLLEQCVVDVTDGESRLTRRENQVLTLLALGLEQRQIAERLEVADKTIGTHIEHILMKLGVRNRTQAVGVAYREGLVDERYASSAAGNAASA